MKVRAVMIGAALLAACSRSAPTPAPREPEPFRLKAVPSEAEQAKLQRIAESACRCERGGGAKEACWADFQGSVKSYGPGMSMGSACYPISVSIDCFGDQGGDGPRFCITTGYDLVFTGLTLCSAAESRTVEAAFIKTAGPRHNQADQQRAAVEAKRVALRIIAGDKPRNLPPSNTCAG